MLKKALDMYIMQKHRANTKGQYANRKDKLFFRASSLGLLKKGKRKLIYTFFSDKIKQTSKSAHNLWQLENGNYVHDRFQGAWKDMGIVVYRNGKRSMETELSTKKDDLLSRYAWEIAGHHDGELDMKLIKAYVEGKAWVEPTWQNGKTVLQAKMDLDYGKQIGYFKEDGTLNPDYEPLRMIADIKTMNPYSFKQLKDGDLEPIEGYLVQIMAYMYMLDTPYGCLYVENKANNQALEVQIVWKDMKGGQYDFIPEYHGEEDDDTMRIYLENSMFEGTIEELEKTWNLFKQLQEAEEKGDYKAIVELMPERCSPIPDKFPCKWSTGQCEFFDHCWNDKHKGLWLQEEIAEEVDFDELLKHRPKDKLDDFYEAEIPSTPEVKEYRTENGERAFQCLRCSTEVTFKRLVASCKKCPNCGFVNIVI